jgi:ribonuclease-3
MSLEKLQQKTGYFFKQQKLLETAFMHRSAASNSYERLEFLGDNVLGIIISEYLYNTYPNLREGKLSRMRAHLVCSVSLLKISRRLELYDCITVRKFKGVKKYDLPSSLLADVVESFIGAIYLDSDYETIREIVLGWYEVEFRELNPDDRFKDSKTVLQEKLQSRGQPLPTYVIEDTVEEEEYGKVFHIRCEVKSYGFESKAEGANRKVAEQAAARIMLGMINLAEKEGIEPKW